MTTLADMSQINKDVDIVHNPVVVSIDSGTQSTRAILYDAVTLKRLAISEKFAHPPNSPIEGWSEHTISLIEEAVVKALIDVAAKFPRLHERQMSIGITNQRETVIVWSHKTGKLLHPTTIVWNDGRTAEKAKELNKEWSTEILDDIRSKTGLKVASYYSALKLMWLIKNNEKVEEAAKEGDLRFGTVDSYIIYRLTNQNVHVTDVTNASRTLLFDINKLKFDNDLCNYFDIPMSCLPKALPSGGFFGQLPADLSSYKICPVFQGLPKVFANAKITGVLGDQQAATIGHGLIECGDTKLTLGSGGFILTNCGTTPPEVVPEGCTVSPLMSYDDKEKSILYSIEGSIAHCGMGVSWMEHNLGLLEAKDINDILANTYISDGLIFIPAFSGLLSPWWNESIKGCITGITLKTDRHDIVRAFIESIACQLCEIIKRIDASAGVTLGTVHIDGGLSQSEELVKLLSTFTGARFLLPIDLEMTARGAAIIASIGNNFTTLKELTNSRILHTPDIDGRTDSCKEIRPCMYSQEKVQKIKDNWLKFYNALSSYYDYEAYQGKLL